MGRLSPLAIAVTTAFCSLALADELSVTVSRPALAGYCVQHLRQELQMDQALSSCGPRVTPQKCDEITRPLGATLADARRTFDLWRAYGLSLGTKSASEFLRGVAEANADDAYATEFLAAHPITSEQDVKALQAEAASDPRMKAIQDRADTCQRGPPL